MSTATETTEAVDHDEHDEHISDWGYVKVALLLAALTAVEVFTYFESVLDWGKALVPALLIMMILKFAIVVGYFMHLKFDNKLYRNLFAIGLAGALVLYIAALLTFNLEVWNIFVE